MPFRRINTRSFENVINIKNKNNIGLGILLILFLLFDIKRCRQLSVHIDTFYGQFIIVILAIVVCIKTNPIVGFLAIIVAYKLIFITTASSSNYAIKNFVPSEISKLNEMKSYNTETTESCGNGSKTVSSASGLMIGSSLEEEQVGNIPMPSQPPPELPGSYMPVMDNQCGASPL